MKVIQITDIHIAGVDQITNTVDCFKNFELILEKVKTENADFIVITGDICFEDPDESVYHLVKDRMDKLDVPYYVIPGNHDNSTMLAKIFDHDLIDGECYYGKDQCLFLDTAVGEMSHNQYNWLENKLKTSDNYKFIFMHHPPAKAGVLSMDDSNWTFRQIEKFQQLIHSINRELYIFCGHYHVERFIKLQNLNLFMTPSCYIQIADDQPKFALDHLVPSYRRIEYKNSQFNTTLRYLL